MMDGLARLEELVERLLAAHRASGEERRRLEVELHEGRRAARRLEERLAQALRRVQEMEQERAGLRRQLEELPGREQFEEARARLQRLLDSLDD